MHMHPKTHFQKAVGGVNKFFCGHSSRKKVTPNYTLFLNSTAYMQKKNNGVLTLFCFLKTMCEHGHQESDFQSSFYTFEC